MTGRIPRHIAKVMLAILLLAGIDGKTMAQAPGYLGHRTSVQYSLYAMPAFNMWSYWDTKNYKGTKFFPDGGLFMNATHQLSFDRVLTRRTTMAVNIDYFRTGTRSENLLNQRVHGRITGIGTSVSWRFFPFIRRGNIAPVGPYSEIGLRYFRTSVVDGTETSANFGSVIHRYGFFSLSFSFGHNYMLTDRLILSLGMRNAYTFTTALFSPDFPAEYTGGRVFGHQFYNLYTRFAVLL